MPDLFFTSGSNDQSFFFRLVRSATPHLAGIVLTISLGLTFGAVLLVHFYGQQVNKQLPAAGFQQHREAITAQFDLSAQVLRTTAAMLMLSRTMQRAGWQQFQHNLAAQGWPEGMLQLGYAQRILTAQKGALHAAMSGDAPKIFQVHPYREHPLHAPVLFIAPDVGNIGIGKTGARVGEVGFDLLSVPTIAQLLDQATDSGTIAFRSLDSDVGFAQGLMVLPVFPGNARPANIALRQQQVIGYVFAVLRTDAVLRNVGSTNFKTVQLLDPSNKQPTAKNNTGINTSPNDPTLIRTQSGSNIIMPVELYGTQWHAVLAFTPTSFQQRNVTAAILITVGGVLSSLIFFGLLQQIASKRRSYRSRADASLAEIRQLQDQLATVTACTDRAIIMIDRRQRIISFNPAAQPIFAAVSADVVGTDLKRFLPQRLKGAQRQTGDGQLRSRSPIYRLPNRPGQLACRTGGESFPFDATIIKCKRWGHQGYLILLTDLTGSGLQASQAQVQTPDHVAAPITDLLGTTSIQSMGNTVTEVGMATH